MARLNPPEWTREEVLEFPGSLTGPWARYVHNADARGIGTVRYPRLVARNVDCAIDLKKRTLTNLYNQRPTWLDGFPALARRPRPPRSGRLRRVWLACGFAG